MGSSSVFVVGLMNVLNNFKGKKIKKEQLAQKDVQTDQFLGKKIDYNKTDDMFIL